MEMQVQMPSPPASDFNFHRGRSSPWLQYYCISAPTSPGRASDFYDRELDDFPVIDQTDDDFAFHVSKEAAKCTVSAAELFDGGKIRPLKPPANDPYYGGGGRGGEVEPTTSIRSPLLPSSTSPESSNVSKEDLNWSKGRKNFWSVFTPKRNKLLQTKARYAPLILDDDDNHRGRGRGPYSSTSASSRRCRSLSPIRSPNYPQWELGDDQELGVDGHQKAKKESSNSSSSTSLTTTLVVQAPAASKSSRSMWKLKNFLLFRSASEGRASDKLEEPSKKFATYYERHYGMKKPAASEDMKKKKKTFLPYKRGMFWAAS